MRYTVEIKRSAEREMDRLPAEMHRRISERILALEDNPRPLEVVSCVEERLTDFELVTTGCSTRSVIRRAASSFIALPTDVRRIGDIPRIHEVCDLQNRGGQANFRRGRS